jgi:hypothetical protein
VASLRLRAALRFVGSISYPITCRTASSPSNRPSVTFSSRRKGSYIVDLRPQGYGRRSSRKHEYITRSPAGRLGEHHRAVDSEVPSVEQD